MKVTVIEIKTPSVEEYFSKISSYLNSIINTLKKSDTWKIQLTVANNFISSLDNYEEWTMHSKSDNIEIMINDEADEIIEGLFDSLKNRYQNNLKSMRSNEFVFDYVHLMYDKRHKINPNRGGSYIDSPDWIKNIKATINRINKKDNKCFQYAITVALKNEEIKKDPQRITKIKPFISKYNWEGINYPSEKDDCKKFEKTDVAIALNILYTKKENIYLAYVSKHNSNHEKQNIHLMIPNKEGREAKSEGQRYYRTIKKLSALLRGIAS